MLCWVLDLLNPNSCILASNNGQDLENTNFPFVLGQRSSSLIKSLSSLIAEIEARVEETWKMTECDATDDIGPAELDGGEDTAGVVLQFSQRKL